MRSMRTTLAQKTLENRILSDVYKADLSTSNAKLVVQVTGHFVFFISRTHDSYEMESVE